MCCLRQAFFLAEEVGKSLGWGKILQRQMPGE